MTEMAPKKLVLSWEMYVSLLEVSYTYLYQPYCTSLISHYPLHFLLRMCSTSTLFSKPSLLGNNNINRAVQSSAKDEKICEKSKKTHGVPSTNPSCT